MIFLSAGVPSSTPIEGRKFYGPGNVPAIREAIMAFTKVCVELDIPFCFGGHPAISPLVYQVSQNYDKFFSKKIKIYQSKWFIGKTPEEVSFYKNIIWTDVKEDLQSSLDYMRTSMFQEELNCAVFIGGMDGIIAEANLFHTKHQEAKMIALPNTGGATAKLKEETGLNIDDFPDSYAYVSLFRKYLAGIK